MRNEANLERNKQEREWIESQAKSYGVDAERLADELARYAHWDDFALMNAIARCQE